MKVLLRVAVAAYFAAMIIQPSAADTVVFDQPQDPTVHPGVSSALDFTGEVPGRRTADNFIVTTNASIGRVEWSGLHSPLSSGVDDFRISFYANEADHPGSLLSEVGGSLVGHPNSQILGLTDYRMNLSTLFAAQSGVSYWISIFNQSPGAVWRWNNSVTGDNKSVQSLVPPDNQWFHAQGEGVDLGLRLIATPVPGMGMVTGISVAMLLWARARRRET